MTATTGRNIANAIELKSVGIAQKNTDEKRAPEDVQNLVLLALAEGFAVAFVSALSFRDGKYCLNHSKSIFRASPSNDSISFQ